MSTANATRFRLLPSGRIALLIVVAHGGAAAALLTVLRDSAAGWMLAALLVALGLATAWDRALLRASASVRGLVVDGPDDIVLELARNARVKARVGARRWVSESLVLLPIGLPRRATLLIGWDMLDPEDFRRLRIWALWGRLPGVASTPRGER